MHSQKNPKDWTFQMSIPVNIRIGTFKTLQDEFQSRSSLLWSFEKIFAQSAGSTQLEQSPWSFLSFLQFSPVRNRENFKRAFSLLHVFVVFRAACAAELICSISETPKACALPIECQPSFFNPSPSCLNVACMPGCVCRPEFLRNAAGNRTVF